ncbi:hypothetical protein GE21DRAFT_5379 [Neurospora crassa]|uniref:Uncharacterized protein n=1 Tax=Neurospora crassa (strain ATCC 24698 / 74-OR23-1A / CBS 708.71 / DSM 1257 / FGSC 987) TaxID=367110 RepID=V5INN7_NEUCR|nr:hypothetical protein NCU16744 [Neurospora crassa OR74A]ESA42774.1 hypothetical protein NCU16744 [Neurospora crassa OR74A]KHE81616.1 hypothetical protein GE21DRAFT_5379 [Neurospora crassa]|eukprot:XP_011394364.1 hypothetical protein NCU16744 [Neurospora crassa OR74A]
MSTYLTVFRRDNHCSSRGRVESPSSHSHLLFLFPPAPFNLPNPTRTTATTSSPPSFLPSFLSSSSTPPLLISSSPLSLFIYPSPPPLTTAPRTESNGDLLPSAPPQQTISGVYLPLPRVPLGNQTDPLKNLKRDTGHGPPHRPSQGRQFRVRLR